LQKREAKIKWAKNGEMALEMLEKFKRFDLILMDINLPFLSGYDASIRIKELYPDQIIIAQTAYAVAGDKEKALASGCDAYITKPISEQKLNKIISEFI
jgi:CheY-like chemotaxis protein